MASKEKIHLGIILAGAVTAGAFTAGVMDYIINAFKNWENAYKRDPQNVPKPNITLDILTGASAGSIAAAVTTLGLATDSLPYVEDIRSNEAKNNLLFDTWVNFGLDPNEKIIDSILALDDVQKDETGKKNLRSLLNTSFIENLMKQLIQKTKRLDKVDLPSFINPKLEILMTLSNLRGLPIDLYFSTNDSSVGHTMNYHKAYGLFEFGREAYDKNAQPERLPFDIHNDLHVKAFLNCARASGAFPIGLKSIPFHNVPKEYINANIQRLFGDDVNIVPRVQGDAYNFLAVDGGMTNNEPLAEAMKSLEMRHENYKMILVDPFPSDTLVGDNKYNVTRDSVYDIIPQLFKTLRDQAIFKESDIVELFREDANKHMIWPTRYDKNDNALKNAIACGALSGFSGFLHREFRLHDYQLGQKNAQNFLRYYFHQVLTDDEPYPQVFVDKFAIKDAKGQLMVPLIPDYKIEGRSKDGEKIHFFPAIENNLMPFPVIDFKPILDEVKPKLDNRIKAIVDLSFEKFTKSKPPRQHVHPLIREQNKEGLFSRLFGRIKKFAGNILMGGLGKGLLKNTLKKKIITTMIEEMDEYELIK